MSKYKKELTRIRDELLLKMEQSCYKGYDPFDSRLIYESAS